MGLSLDCPECGAGIVFQFLRNGEFGKCPECGAEIRVPEDAEVVGERSSVVAARLAELRPEPPSRPPPPVDTPWPVVPTIALAAAAYLGAAIFGGLVVAVSGCKPGLGAPQFDFALALGTCSSALIGVPLIVKFSRMRHGPPVRRYLALDAFPVATMLTLLLAGVGVNFLVIVAYGVLTDPVETVGEAVGLSPVGKMALVCTALIVAAPILEELVFRGFVFAGLRSSTLGVPGAIIGTTLAWAAAHGDFSASALGIRAVQGVLLGIVRWRTGSVYAPMALHAGMNLQVVVLVLAWLR